MGDTGRRQARRVTTLVRGDETGGRLAVMELREVPGQEPPCHLHANEDEIVYVLEGHLTCWIGDDAHRVGAGACLFLPRGIEHGYAVESGTARLLIVVTPAGSEPLLGKLDTSRCAVDLEHLIAVAACYGIAITGPAPTPHRSATDTPASRAAASVGEVVSAITSPPLAASRANPCLG